MPQIMQWIPNSFPCLQSLLLSIINTLHYCQVSFGFSLCHCLIKTLITSPPRIKPNYWFFLILRPSLMWSLANFQHISHKQILIPVRLVYVFPPNCTQWEDLESHLGYRKKTRWYWRSDFSLGPRVLIIKTGTIISYVMRFLQRLGKITYWTLIILSGPWWENKVCILCCLCVLPEMYSHLYSVF